MEKREPKVLCDSTHATAVRVNHAHPLWPPWCAARRARRSFMPPEKARTGEASQVPPSPPYPAKRAPPGLIEPLELAQEISEQPHADGLPTCEPCAPPRQNCFTDRLTLASGVDCRSKFWEMPLRAGVQRPRELASRYPIAAKPPLAPLKREIFPDRGNQRYAPCPFGLVGSV